MAVMAVVAVVTVSGSEWSSTNLLRLRDSGYVHVALDCQQGRERISWTAYCRSEDQEICEGYRLYSQHSHIRTNIQICKPVTAVAAVWQLMDFNDGLYDYSCLCKLAFLITICNVTKSTSFFSTLRT